MKSTHSVAEEYNGIEQPVVTSCLAVQKSITYMIVQCYDLKGDFTMLNLFSETFKKILISIRKFRLSKKY